MRFLSDYCEFRIFAKPMNVVTKLAEGKKHRRKMQRISICIETNQCPSFELNHRLPNAITLIVYYLSGDERRIRHNFKRQRWN
jgi:hypothetical protein